jgi:hypothetical protein
MTIQTKKSRDKIEFGDFQTPAQLSRQICTLVQSLGIRPQSVIEPTCGKGSFVIACLEAFDSIKQIIGIDINKEYLSELNDKLLSRTDVTVTLYDMDIFAARWDSLFSGLTEPLLIIGNPPWVTNSALGAMDGTNLPIKKNFEEYSGLDAITGKANFDISQWIITHFCEWIQNRDALLAMLCKTSVARRVLRHVWRNNLQLSEICMYLIDAKRHFGASVKACLLLCKSGARQNPRRCLVYEGLSNPKQIGAVGMDNSELVADLETYAKWAFLDGVERYKWRSGVKHDCAEVMEFIQEGRKFRNGLGELCDLEGDLLYPFYKSSDIAKNNVTEPKRWVLITQKKVEEDTILIRERAPKTWDYLLQHSSKLDRRKSSIYKGRSRFSLFGIGDYAFYPWKVCISGLYQKVQFSVVGPHANKPPMVDDTCYYISCNNKKEALLLADILNSDAAKKFLQSLIFWDSKRPITIDILHRLDLFALAHYLGKSDLLEQYFSKTLFDRNRFQKD